MLLGFDHHNGPLKDDIEGGRGFEAADEFLQVPMRKPRSKSVSIFIYIIVLNPLNHLIH